MHPTSIADTQSAIFVLQRHSFYLPCLADSEHAGLQISKKKNKKKNKLSSLLWTQENESNKKSTWYIVNVYCTETIDLKVLNVIVKKLPIYLFQAL